MIKLHKIYFFFWKLFLRIQGIKIGRFYYEYSNYKGKLIKGVITSINGDSINHNNFALNIGINWLEPLCGNDSRYYTSGNYSYNDIIKKLKKC